MFSVNFVSTVPFVGVGGAISGVGDLARGSYEVVLLSAGRLGHLETELTASPARPRSPAKNLMTAARGIGGE